MTNVNPFNVWLLFPALLCLLLSLPAAAQTRALPSAEKIVDQYLKAIGGKKKVSAIRDATYDWTIELKDQSMGVAKVQLRQPASQRFEMTFRDGQIISAANPRSAWVLGLDGQLRTLTGPEAGAARLGAALDAAHLLDFKKANVMARVISLENSKAGQAYVVEFSSRAGTRLRYSFSPSSKMLIGIQDPARKSELWFEDFRSDGNILEPHTIRMSQIGGGTGS